MGQPLSMAFENGNKSWTPETRWELKRFIERRLARGIKMKSVIPDAVKEFGRSPNAISTCWRDIKNGNAELPVFADPDSNASIDYTDVSDEEAEMTSTEFGLNPNHLDFCNLGHAITAIESDFNHMLRTNRDQRQKIEDLNARVDQLLAEKEVLAENQMNNSLLVNQHSLIEEMELRAIELKGELEVWQMLANENEDKVQQLEKDKLEMQNQLSQALVQLDAIFAGARDHYMSQAQGGRAKLELVK